MKRLPAPEMPGTGSSFDLAAVARYEIQKRSFGRHTEIIRVKFKVRGGALVPIPS